MSRHQMIHFPEVGKRRAYLLYHEELESLVRYIPGLQRIRFWMTFSESYLRHLEVLQNLGLTRIDPVEFQSVHKRIANIDDDINRLLNGLKGKSIHIYRTLIQKINCRYSTQRFYNGNQLTQGTI